MRRAGANGAMIKKICDICGEDATYVLKFQGKGARYSGRIIARRYSENPVEDIHRDYDLCKNCQEELDQLVTNFVGKKKEETYLKANDGNSEPNVFAMIWELMNKGEEKK